MQFRLLDRTEHVIPLQRRDHNRHDLRNADADVVGPKLDVATLRNDDQLFPGRGFSDEPQEPTNVGLVGVLREFIAGMPAMSSSLYRLTRSWQPASSRSGELSQSLTDLTTSSCSVSRTSHAPSPDAQRVSSSSLGATYSLGRCFAERAQIAELPEAVADELTGADDDAGQGLEIQC